MFFKALTGFALAALGGCASQFIDVTPGSEKVAAAAAEQVAQCRKVGKTTVNVVAQVSIYSRSIDDVDANLLQMARNGAVDLGGDTVVAGQRLDTGRRVFDVYKCAP